MSRRFNRGHQKGFSRGLKPCKPCCVKGTILCPGRAGTRTNMGRQTSPQQLKLSWQKAGAQISGMTFNGSTEYTNTVTFSVFKVGIYKVGRFSMLPLLNESGWGI